MARKGKTLEQQCKYYNCEDFVRDVMLYHYNCGRVPTTTNCENAAKASQLP